MAKHQSLQGDFMGAFLGAIAILPQAIAYGLIAVSPLGPEWAVFGITISVGSAILFTILVGLMGGHPFLISGPTAVTSLVIATAISEGLSRGLDAETAITLAFLGAFVAGIMQLAAGIAKLGRAVSFIPTPVLVGFIMASALLVTVKSLPMALGAPALSLAEIITTGVSAIDGWAAAVSGLTIAAILLSEGRFKTIPAALIGLVVGTGVFHLGTGTFALPDGPMVGFVDLSNLIAVPLALQHGLSAQVLETQFDIPLLTGLSVALLTALHTVLTAAAMDAKTGTDTNPDRELTVQGIVNTLMAVLGFLPGSAALTRSTVCYRAGAKTRYAAMGSGLVFALMLTVLAPMVSQLPLWATAGMLIATALQAIDRTTLSKVRGILLRTVPYRRVLAGDVTVTALVVVTALTFDLIAAVGFGILLAVVLFVFGMGRDPIRRAFTCERMHSSVQRSARQMECLEREGRRIGVIELRGALFFGACAALLGRAKEMLDAGTEFLILDVRHLSSVDSTGAETLRNLHLMCLQAGGRLMISCLEPERRAQRDGAAPDEAENRDRRQRDIHAPRWVWLTLDANGVIDLIGADNISDNTDAAIAHCEEALLDRLGMSGRAGTRGIIAASPLFDGLSRTQILEIAPFAQRQLFEAGDYVFRQNQAGDSAYFLISGRMEVLIDIPGSSRQRRLMVLTEGSLFGEMALLDGGPRSANIVASKRAVCLKVTRQGFEALEARHPDLLLVLMKNLNRQFADRLRIANTMISELEQ
jgi:SulP family sulfate permease